MDNDHWIVEYCFRDDTGVEQQEDMPSEWTSVSESWYSSVSNGGDMDCRPLTEIIARLDKVRTIMASFYVFRVRNMNTDETIPVDVLV